MISRVLHRAEQMFDRVVAKASPLSLASEFLTPDFIEAFAGTPGHAQNLPGVVILRNVKRPETVTANDPHFQTLSYGS